MIARLSRHVSEFCSCVRTCYTCDVLCSLFLVHVLVRGESPGEFINKRMDMSMSCFR
jgi:hypothetical protein